MTQISPMLAVADGKAAMEFYRKAFGAEVLWQIDAGGGVVAGMAIQGAQFFLASESPDYGTRSPSAAGFTTVRIELFVDDPVAVHQKAVAAGAKNREGVVEHNYQTAGPKPIGRMLQGSVFDPSGHMWLIGKIL
jgi:PhnB protein